METPKRRSKTLEEPAMLSVYLEARQVRKLEELARQNDRSASYEVRRALDRYFAEAGAQPLAVA